MGFAIMKNTIAVLSALLFVTTVAFGQQYQASPFPQAANPALVNGAAAQTSPSVTSHASSMAANHAEISPSVVNRHYQVNDGAPFPSAANPALADGASEETSSSVVAHASHQVDNGSPFPSAANPGKNW